MFEYLVTVSLSNRERVRRIVMIRQAHHKLGSDRLATNGLRTVGTNRGSGESDCPASPQTLRAICRVD
jgi:hypothetical protein